jgi:hypothetical protein
MKMMRLLSQMVSDLQNYDRLGKAEQGESFRGNATNRPKILAKIL